MKNKKLIYISLLLFILAATGCKKYIDMQPKDSTYDEVFWTNQANAEKSVAGAYSLLRSAMQVDNSHFIFGDLTTGNFWEGWDQWNLPDLTPTKGNNYHYAPYLEYALWDWSRYYKVINQCHLAIEKIPSIPSSKFSSAAEKNNIIGQALFLRAYTYFYITRVWGDPILTKESLKDPTNVPNLGRAPESEVLDYCLTDLKNAAGMLTYSGDKAFAGKEAAWALMAHIYAWRHDYASSNKYCDSIINGNKYSLESADDYLKIWDGNSAESIFELNMKYNANSNEGSAGFMGVFLMDPFIKGKTGGNTWVINADIITDMIYTEEGDMRLEKAVGYSGDGDHILLKYSNVNYYDANNQGSYVVDNNLVLFRLADIYLLKAEALYKTGNEAGSRAMLNIIRERAGLEATNASGYELWDEIFIERNRELIGEASIAYDLIRMELLTDYLSGSFSQERIDKKGYYWPLDMRRLLQQAPLLTQNEWWKNH